MNLRNSWVLMNFYWIKSLIILWNQETFVISIEYKKIIFLIFLTKRNLLK